MNASGATHDSRLITKLFFRLLPVQIMLVMVGSVNGIVSSLFGSNFVGVTAMSAIGLYAPVQMFLTAMGNILLGGSQLLCGRYMGRNLMERTQDVFTVDLLVSALVGGLVAVALALAAALDVTVIVSKDAAERAILNRYILGQVIGILPLLMGQQLSAFLSMENKGRRTTIASVAYVASNLLLNVLFVVVLKLGAFGLALSSSLGLWVFFGVQAQMYLSGKTQLKLTLRGAKPGDMKDIVNVGLPNGMKDAYETLRGVIVNGLVLHYVGSAGLSAFAASDSVLRIFWAIPFGMLAVSRMLFGICIGEEDRQSLADVMRVAIYRCIPIMCCVSAVIILCAEPFTRLFYRDPTFPVYQMTVNAFRILPICMPLSIISLHFTCYAQASGKKLLVQLLPALDGCVFVAGFSALLVPRIGMNGVYFANIGNGIGCAVVILLYSAFHYKRLPRNMEELMVIPEDFGAAEDMRLDITVRQIPEVLQVSQKVMDFMTERGVDRERAYFAGLCLEEMAGNVVEHGFHKDNKRHSVDIRVVLKDDIILRLRDDCQRFDPSTRRDIVDPEDKAANFGIRLVYGIAKSVTYQNMLGMNVLTIRL